MNNIWETIINDIKSNPRDLCSIPQGKRTPIWFYVYTDGLDIIVMPGKEHIPASRIKEPRYISEKELLDLYPIYLRRKMGENVSTDAQQISLNSTYIYSLIKFCYEENENNRITLLSDDKYNISDYERPIDPRKKFRKDDTYINSEIPLSTNTELKLGEEQQELFNILENTREDIFVMGKAGTGKSVLLRHFISNTKKNVIVLAPTGIAAINVGGQTIHSFFAFDFTALNPDEVVINNETAQILINTDVLLIDEISVLRSDIMECINRKCQIARKNNLPFGGIQFICFGDLYQLSPVVADYEIKKYLDENFGGSYFFHAPVIRQCNLAIHELEHIYRQSDKVFQHMLGEIRIGCISDDTLSKFNDRCVRIPEDNVITIATTNKIVNEVNDLHIMRLNGKEYIYAAEIEGDKKQCIRYADNRLRLRVGAQVMMLRNDYRKRWANGTIGVIIDLSEDEISVKINGNVYSIERATWETRRHTYNTNTKRISQEAIAKFTQFPICLAWAFTIHKSQGQTYDKVVIDFGRGAFVHGQAYVALSRCRSLQGMYLKAPLRRNDLIIDESVKEFISINKRIG
jgi:hypothetical protein